MELGRMLNDQDAEVRAQAALALGKMRQKSSMPLLKSILADEQDWLVRLNLLEALARMGDQRSAVKLEAYTKGFFVDDRLAAIPALARGGSPRTIPVLESLMNERHPPRVRIAAGAWLAELGNFKPAAYHLAVEAAQNPSRVLRRELGPDAEIKPLHVRQLQHSAAMALGRMGRPAAVDVLAPLMRHDSGVVRVAAALGVLRLLPEAGPAPAAMTNADDGDVMPAPQPEPHGGATVTAPPTEPDSDVVVTPATKPARRGGLHTSGARD
jgi:HEAT repeat protein